ncbi:GYD domain-containing protein [Haloarchaeobius sp. HME9146]|uniref:GYD domain-containing protein n=1 Tax=Haloarchaeobius sp. HME9146 TaxID=2978732 RepID=UPI0021BF3193|nr:GYD domain-containing protein [Haloarchaeobius sp. HME9146]MCT9094816.1 GYD domain-containing protein [Haloarchaeobius sp. HME9146]
MPTYIMLVTLNQKGAENIEQSPDRLEMVKERTRSLGGEPKEFYMTFGRYDFVYVADLPDDEAAAHLALTYERGGAGKFETVKAFTEDEYREVIRNLPE